MWLLLRLVAYTGGALLLSVLAVLLYLTFFPKRVHELKGLCCAVTGASDGLGVFIAHALAAEGAEKLVLGARRVEKLEEVKADLAKHFPKVKVLTVKLDVTDGESRNDFLRQATTFGPCQVLINNAGVMTSCFFESFPTEALDAMLQTNLCGTLRLTKLFLPELFKQKQAHVVNISSITSKLPVPYSSIYAATKAALSSFSLSLRLEMLLEQSPVTVHCVSPGLVKDTGLAERACQNTGTTIEESGKNVGYTTPEEVARAVVRAIQYDEAEVVVNSNRLQPVFALTAFFPSFWEIVTPMMENAGLESTQNLRKGAEQTLLGICK